jgi:hypothetical protein
MRFTPLLAFAVLGLSNAAPASAQVGINVPPKFVLAQREMDIMNKRLAWPHQTRNAIQINPQKFDKYVGTYEVTPVGIFHFSRKDNRYFVTVTGTGGLTTNVPADIFPESETKFYAEAIEQEFNFISDRRGQVTGTRIYGLSRDGNFPDGVYLKKIDPVAAQSGEVALKAHVNSHVPDPKMGAALQRAIKGFMIGRPVYRDMTPELAKQTRQFLSDYPNVLSQLGVFKYLEFEHTDQIGADLYDVEFISGKSEWRIMPLTPDGKIFRVTFTVPLSPDPNRRIMPSPPAPPNKGSEHNDAPNHRWVPI